MNGIRDISRIGEMNGIREVSETPGIEDVEGVLREAYRLATVGGDILPPTATIVTERREKSIVTKWAPILNEMKKTDPLIQKIEFIPQNSSRLELSRLILEAIAVTDDTGKSVFERTSLLGIAYLLPLLDYSSISLTEMEYTLYFFWQMVSRLYLSKQVSQLTYGAKDTPLPFLLETYGQDRYLTFFPSFFQAKTGIDLSTLEIKVYPRDVYQLTLNLSKYLPTSVLFPIKLTHLYEDRFYDPRTETVVLGPYLSEERRSKYILAYSIDLIHAVGTTIAYEVL